MNIFEIRIGNYVYSKELDLENGKEKQVLLPVDLYVLHEVANGNRFDKYTHVPLTTDWLEKLAFEKINHRIEGVIFKKSWLVLNENILYAVWRGGAIGKIETVARLQNLYFDLTGEQLIKAENEEKGPGADQK